MFSDSIYIQRWLTKFKILAQNFAKRSDQLQSMRILTCLFYIHLKPDPVITFLYFFCQASVTWHIFCHWLVIKQGKSYWEQFSFSKSLTRLISFRKEGRIGRCRVKGDFWRCRVEGLGRRGVEGGVSPAVEVDPGENAGLARNSRVDLVVGQHHRVHLQPVG